MGKFILDCVLIAIMAGALCAAIHYTHLVIIGLVEMFRKPSLPRYVLDLTGRAPWLR